MSSTERISLSNTPNLAPIPQPGDLNYVPPADIAPLPSKGLIYPPESPFHNLEFVEIRAMTTRDEDILSSRALLKQGKALDALLRSCLVNKGVDVSQLISGDRNAILTTIRITGYGPEYKPEVECPKCEEKGRPEPGFNLSQMAIKRLGAEPISPGVNAFRFSLPLSKKEVVFKLLTGADEKELSQILEGQKKKSGSAIESGITMRLRAHILSFAGESDSTKLMRLIENMSPRDSRALRRYIAEIEPNIEMKETYTCPNCQEEMEVDVPMTTDFFWPST